MDGVKPARVVMGCGGEALSDGSARMRRLEVRRGMPLEGELCAANKCIALSGNRHNGHSVHMRPCCSHARAALMLVLLSCSCCSHARVLLRPRAGEAGWQAAASAGPQLPPAGRQVLGGHGQVREGRAGAEGGGEGL